MCVVRTESPARKNVSAECTHVCRTMCFPRVHCEYGNDCKQTSCKYSCWACAKHRLANKKTSAGNRMGFTHNEIWLHVDTTYRTLGNIAALPCSKIWTWGAHCIDARQQTMTGSIGCNEGADVPQEYHVGTTTMQSWHGRVSGWFQTRWCTWGNRRCNQTGGYSDITNIKKKRNIFQRGLNRCSFLHGINTYNLKDPESCTHQLRLQMVYPPV